MAEPNPPILSRAWWLLKIQTWGTSLPPLTISTFVFGTAALAALLYPPYIRQEGDPHNWVVPLLPEMTNSISFASTNLPAEQSSRLEEQARYVSGRATHHFRVMQFYYTNYYVALLLGSVYGGIAAMSLFLLTKAGWQQGGKCLGSLFLTTTVCTTFFFTFPTWCRMDETVTKNKALYVRYVALLNDMRTFLATGNFAQDPQPTNAPTAANFILRMDNEMKKANDIAVTFDATKGPIYNLSAEKTPK